MHFSSEANAFKARELHRSRYSKMLWQLVMWYRSTMGSRASSSREKPNREGQGRKKQWEPLVAAAKSTARAWTAERRREPAASAMLGTALMPSVISVYFIIIFSSVLEYKSMQKIASLFMVHIYSAMATCHYSTECIYIMLEL